MLAASVLNLSFKISSAGAALDRIVHYNIRTAGALPAGG